MFNCIYESGMVLSQDNAACPYDDRILGGDGSPLVDVIEESQNIDVITEAPSSIPWLPLVAVGLVFLLSTKKGG